MNFRREEVLRNDSLLLQLAVGFYINSSMSSLPSANCQEAWKSCVNPGAPMSSHCKCRAGSFQDLQRFRAKVY